MPLLKDQKCTATDYWALPDGRRAELIDGTLYDLASPSRIHQKAVSALNWIISDYIQHRGGPCEVYPAPFLVNLNGDESCFVEPDLSVICDPDKLSDRGCEGAPDWVIEIVSPSSRRMDCQKKIALYGEAGVREYWIVDPAHQRATVYRFEADEAPTVYSFDQPVPVGIYDGFEIVIAALL
ncbi:MAG: Uma2 family endonuclease [Eubacteriales bacterium]|nr:Uma2 family endonuclease [Eubacteriales bacterium]